MNSFGFIITRHVRCEQTNKYWNNSLKCLNKLYPNRKVVIIDDNSNPDFLKADKKYDNVIVIQSEFIGRGELLPYYYYLKNKFFDNAIIIHDSVFIHNRFDYNILIKDNVKVLPFWSFFADRENLENRIRILSSLKNAHTIYSKLILENTVMGMPYDKWFGCFGGQSFINHNFLIFLENKYNISNMINYVKCRPDRCSLERILGCLFCTEYPKLLRLPKKSLLGNIHRYQKWGYKYSQYEDDVKQNKLPKEIVKIWTGR